MHNCPSARVHDPPTDSGTTRTLSPEDQTTPDGGQPSTFELGRGDAIVLGLICVIAGVALGFFLPEIGNFAATFPIPFGEPIEKLSRFDQPLVVMLRPVIGAILGMGGGDGDIRVQPQAAHR